MESQEYIVGVKIIEARKLHAKDASGTNDPYVKISVGEENP